MSFSIKTILKLICLLGLFACTSKSANAQGTIIDIIGDFGRTDTTMELSRILKNPTALTVEYESQNHRLRLGGVAQHEVRKVSLLGLNGERITLSTIMTNQAIYQVPRIEPGYYVLLIEGNGQVLTKNIHLQH